MYDITYMWNFKNNTNESIYKGETDSQIQKTNLWLPRGREKWLEQIRSIELTDYYT